MYMLKELSKRVVAKISEGQRIETKKRKTKNILLFKTACVAFQQWKLFLLTSYSTHMKNIQN